MAFAREVVVTGVGVVSPLGIGREAFWAALLAGRSAVAPLEHARFGGVRYPMGAEILDFDPKLYVRPRKTIKVMAPPIQTAFAAAELASQDAGLTDPAGQRLVEIDSPRFGCITGSELFFGDIRELEDVYRNCSTDGHFQRQRWWLDATRHMFPLWMLKHLPNMPACQISIAHDARGPNNTIVQWDVCSLLAIGEAAEVVARGHADVMFAGGSGSRLNLTSFPHRSDPELSARIDRPAAACRPFEADRDGFVNGEGAAMFVLESAEHAAWRGARTFAKILGHASAFEPAKRHEDRQGKAIELAIANALRSAGVEANEVDHVNAHGLATRHDDRIEARAIRAALGNVPVTAPKSYFGQLGAGSGAVELAASILALAEGAAPATLNYERPDAECPVNVIRGEPRPIAGRAAVAINHSTLGQAATVVVGRA